MRVTERVSGMTTGLSLCCLAQSPSFISTNCSSRATLGHICKLGRAVFHSTMLLHGSPCCLFLVGSAIRKFDVGCSSSPSEKLEPEEADYIERKGEGEGEEEEGSREEGGTMRQELRVEDLRIGGVYKGKVSVVESYGAFVDIGAPINGFVHISRLLSSSFVKRVEDVVQVGQHVTVRIMDLNPCAGFVSLLLMEQDFVRRISLQPLALSEQEILNRAASRRASKSSRCSQALSRRRVMSLETRQRLKNHTRIVVAEQQAFQLHQVRWRASRSESSECAPVVDVYG